MKRRVIRSMAALFVGLAMSFMVAEPVAAVYVAGPEVAFTGHLYYHQWNRHFCGVGHSQVGDEGSLVGGWVFTRPALFFGACNLGTSTAVPSYWLGVQVITMANGNICGQSEMYYNPTASGLFGVGLTLCPNPPGWQEWRTIGGHMMMNPSTWMELPGTSISPWALY